MDKKAMNKCGRVVIIMKNKLPCTTYKKKQTLEKQKLSQKTPTSLPMHNFK